MSKVLKEDTKVADKFRKLEDYMRDNGLVIYRHYTGLSIYDTETGREFVYADGENINFDHPQEFPYALESRFVLIEE